MARQAVPLQNKTFFKLFRLQFYVDNWAVALAAFTFFPKQQFCTTTPSYETLNLSAAEVNVFALNYVDFRGSP